MKIASINEKESGEFWIALNTEPPLTEKVFDQYKMLHAIDPILSRFKPDHRSDTSFLILSSTNPIDSAFPPKFIEAVERALISAEALVAQEAARRGEQEKLQRNQRKEKIQSAAQNLGIPIK